MKQRDAKKFRRDKFRKQRDEYFRQGICDDALHWTRLCMYYFPARISTSSERDFCAVLFPRSFRYDIRQLSRSSRQSQSRSYRRSRRTRYLVPSTRKSDPRVFASQIVNKAVRAVGFFRSSAPSLTRIALKPLTFRGGNAIYPNYQLEFTREKRETNS